MPAPPLCMCDRTQSNPHPETLIDSDALSVATRPTAGTSESPSFDALLATMAVERSDNAIIGLTPGGLIKTWNHGAELLYAYAALVARDRGFGGGKGPPARQNGELR